MTHFDLFDPFLGWSRHHGETKLQNFEIVILKTNTFLYFWLSFHCVKSVCIWSYYGPCFPAFGLNTEWYGVSLCIQSECGKIRTRITPNTEKCSGSTFSYYWYMKFWVILNKKFWLMTSPRKSKLQYLEKVISERNSSLQSSIKYWFQSIYHPWHMI